MEVSKLGIESKLQLPAYTTAIATLDPSHICDLPHSLQQHWIFNPLSKTRDWTCILRDNIGSLTRWATVGTPRKVNFF